jgi:hypothetical protein
MEVGKKVTVTLKDGSKARGTVTSTKPGWVTVELKDGKQKAFRLSAVATPKADKVEGEDAPLIQADLEHYVLHDSTTATGRKHLDIDDDVAQKLREMDLGAIYKYAAGVLEVTQKELHERYQNLNPGMQRMNLGNRIRAVYNMAAKAKGGFSAHKKAA